MNAKKRFSASAMLFLGMAIFGSGTPVSKIVGESFPPILASGLRMALAGILLLPFALIKTKNLFQLTAREWRFVALVALFGNVAFSLLMLGGMRLVPGVVGSVVMSTTPMVTALASVYFLKESMNLPKLLALAFGFTGALFINLSFMGGNTPGTIITLATGSLLVFAAVCSETTYSLIGKVALKDMKPIKLATLSALVAAALFVPLMIWDAVTFDWHSVKFSHWSALVWWGAGTMALGSVLWYSGIENVPGHVAAGFMAVMPVSALLLSYFLLGERFDWLHLLGFGFTFIGVLLIMNQHIQASRTKE